VCNSKVLWDVTDSVDLTMRDLTDEFIQSYLTQAGTAIFSSVGGYRLEDLGAQLFTRVDGDFFTVLGLPLLPLLAFLRSKQILNI
jgi:septum formation protein